MAQLLAASLSFPGAVYTVLLGVVLLYWLFVVFGAVGVDLLGEGALDHAGGGVDGALEGATKGTAEAALGGLGAGSQGAHGGLGAGAEVDHGGMGAEGQHGGEGAGGWLGALHLRSAPATVVISLIVTFSWLASVVTSYALDAWGPGPEARWALGSIVLVLAPLASLPATALVVRPLARLFVTALATRGTRDFVGKICTVRTGTVDAAFGEAVIAERGAEVIVRVRLDDDELGRDALAQGALERGALGRVTLGRGALGRGALGRGDRALIVAFDEARDAFVVTPFDEVMGAPGRGGKPG